VSGALTVHLGGAAPPTQPFDLDWFGNPPRYPAHFTLSLRGNFLHYQFWTAKAPDCDRSYRSGDFVEGLWERDVAELFLMGPQGNYHEFNLSPSGAWWCASFSGYRQRIAARPCPSVQVSSSSEGPSWTASLLVDLRDIPCLEGAGLQRAQISVTAILDPAQPEYLCSGHQSGGQPDFHRASTFLPVLLQS
jgi:hypothetical protein